MSIAAVDYHPRAAVLFLVSGPDLSFSLCPSNPHRADAPTADRGPVHDCDRVHHVLALYDPCPPRDPGLDRDHD